MSAETSTDGPDFAGFAAALALAIRASGMVRRQVADRAGRGCTETTLTNWLACRGKPDYVAVFRVEKALDLAPGALSRHLGFGPCEGSPSDVQAAILADDSLKDEAKDVLLRVYRALR